MSNGLVKSFIHPFIIVMMSLFCFLFVLSVYVMGPLEGKFNHYFMPAEKFGIPSDLKAHGITELYKGNYETGWDGQFYFYIANDPFALKDTAQHIDSNAYRYQRVGLPFIAYAIAKITHRTWVSPLLYYLTGLTLILVAVGVGAAFFSKQGLSPYLILLWVLGCGTQVTQLHGLPDAPADALLIIALISLYEKKFLFYLVAITFAGLSREIYFLIPASFIFVTLALNIKEKKFAIVKLNNISIFFKAIWFQLVPVIIIVGWQIFIRIKFGVSPVSQRSSTLGWPLVNAFNFMLTGLRGMHPIAGSGYAAYKEGAGIVIFLILLALSLFSLRHITRTSINKKENATYLFELGFCLAFAFIILIYFCLGYIVMMDYKGYFKAANIFLFIIPFCYALRREKIPKFFLVMLVLTTIYFDIFLWQRIHAAPYSIKTAVKANSGAYAFKR